VTGRDIEGQPGHALSSFSAAAGVHRADLVRARSRRDLRGQEVELNRGRPTRKNSCTWATTPLELGAFSAKHVRLAPEYRV
jgi:hypothetical protein